MDLAGGRDFGGEAAAAEGAVDRDLQRGRQVVSLAKPFANAGKSFFERGDDFADGRAFGFDLGLAGGKVAELEGDEDAGHIGEFS